MKVKIGKEGTTEEKSRMEKTRVRTEGPKEWTEGLPAIDRSGTGLARSRLVASGRKMAW